MSASVAGQELLAEAERALNGDTSARFTMDHVHALYHDLQQTRAGARLMKDALMEVKRLNEQMQRMVGA